MLLMYIKHKKGEEMKGKTREEEKGENGNGSRDAGRG